MRDEEFITFFMYVLPATLPALSTVQAKGKQFFVRLLFFTKKKNHFDNILFTRAIEFFVTIR